MAERILNFTSLLSKARHKERLEPLYQSRSFLNRTSSHSHRSTGGADYYLFPSFSPEKPSQISKETREMPKAAVFPHCSGLCCSREGQRGCSGAVPEQPGRAGLAREPRGKRGSPASGTAPSPPCRPSLPQLARMRLPSLYSLFHERLLRIQARSGTDSQG